MIPDELKAEAYRVAYYLHPDLDITLKITCQAVESAEVEINTDRNNNNGRNNNKKTKLELPEEIVLLEWVFKKSTEWEKDQERNALNQRKIEGNDYRPTEIDLLIRYIELLICETLRYKSTNYAAVAVGCYLYQYEPDEICGIFEEMLDSDNIRHAAERIRAKIEKRFPEIKFVRNSQTTSKKVETKKKTTLSDREIINKSLCSFTEWPNSHLSKSVVLRLYNTSTICTDYSTSLNHPLFCQACFGFPSFVALYNDDLPKQSFVRLDDPANKLGIPIFPTKYYSSGGANGVDRNSPPPFGPNTGKVIDLYIRQKQKRRQSYFADLLDTENRQPINIRIKVDGELLLEFDPRLGNKPFEIPQFASYVELSAFDDQGELLLAVFPLDDLEPVVEGPQCQMTAHHEEWKLKCTIMPSQEGADGLVITRVRIDVVAGIVTHPSKHTSSEPLWRINRIAENLRKLLEEGALLFVAALRARPSGDPENEGLKRRFTFSLAELGMKHSMTLSRDLALGFVIWPLICAAIIGGVLSALGQSGGMILFGMTDGTLMSLTGTVICGVAATLVGSAAAGVFVAVAFGIAHALLVSMAGIDHVINQVQNAEIMTTVLGGVASFVSPPIILLAITGGAILITSYLMGNSVREEQDRYPLSTKMWGAIIGSLAGGLIGVTYGLTQLLSNIIDDRIAFVLVFGPIGAAAFGAATLMKKISSKRSMAFGMMHFLVTLLIITLGFVVFRGTKEGLIFTSMANAFFHGTFFVLSYLLGERIGGKWAGIGACALEGVGGYLGYLFVIHYLLN